MKQPPKKFGGCFYIIVFSKIESIKFFGGACVPTVVQAAVPYAIAKRNESL